MRINGKAENVTIMDERKPPTTKESDNRYRQVLMDYLSLHRNDVFEESDISRETKVPKMSIRRLLNSEPGIDQKLLNYGKPDGRVCFRG